MEGEFRSMLQCPIGSVVTVPDCPLCCGRCYVATNVSLEVRYIAVRPRLAPLVAFGCGNAKCST